MQPLKLCDEILQVVLGEKHIRSMHISMMAQCTITMPKN